MTAARGLASLAALAVVVGAPAASAGGGTWRCSEVGGSACDGAIPDGWGALETSLTLPADACAVGEVVTTVRAELELAHMELGDLEATLAHPDGTAAIAAGGGLCSGLQRMEVASDAFAGRPAGGTWTLTVADGEHGYFGRLLDWTLAVTCSLARGEACAADAECATAACVDGFCCEAGAVEVCNAVDDDCDGVTDEGYDGLGAACDGDDADDCATGVVVCAAGGAGTTCAELSASDRDEDGVPDLCDPTPDGESDGDGDGCGSCGAGGGAEGAVALTALTALLLLRRRRRALTLD
ncbi:MAG: proprotein convertase P-domain-containing protein [Deltaproteobacteria bacterium]|nr:proprotein convertase P-domain-containing protein [Deltaproteobacteria bacterium]